MPTRWPDPATLRDDLTPHQRDVLAEIFAGPLAGPVVLLTGTPGTGKTFAAGAVVDQLAREHGEHSIAVCAPTGKAAVRVTQAIRKLSRARVDAKTIHQTLEISKNGHATDGDWGFLRNATNPLAEQFVLIDEASMCDTGIMGCLLQACATGTHVLIVGDPHQLPPVGHGAPLRDMIAAGIPCAELAEIRRNAGMIVHACAAIKNGREWEIADRYDPEAGMNLRHIEAADAKQAVQALEAILTQFRASGKFDATWGVQVICGTNRTRKAVNKVLQVLLNPVADGGGKKFQHPFRRDDKIICLRNHWAESQFDRGRTYYVANGEIGRVLQAEEKGMAVEFHGRPALRVPIGKVRQADDEEGQGEEDSSGGSGAGCHMDLAYCVTGHKMQGSEAPCAIVLIEEGPGVQRVCGKGWIYTCLSRATRLCITVGREGVLRQMAKREDLTRRKTFLRELLTGA